MYTIWWANCNQLSLLIFYLSPNIFGGTLWYIFNIHQYLLCILLSCWCTLACYVCTLIWSGNHGIHQIIVVMKLPNWHHVLQMVMPSCFGFYLCLEVLPISHTYNVVIPMYIKLILHEGISCIITFYHYNLLLRFEVGIDVVALGFLIWLHIPISFNLRNLWGSWFSQNQGKRKHNLVTKCEVIKWLCLQQKIGVINRLFIVKICQ
jgi:hypothetical protein